MSRTTRALALGTILASLPAATTGCDVLRAAAPILSDVLLVIDDAQAILNIIDSAAKIWFDLHPDAADAKAKYVKAMGRCRVALDGAIRVVRGSKSLDEGQVDQAFAEFRAAYVDLTALLAASGIKAADGKLGAGPDVVAVPEPLVMKYRAVEHR